MDGLTLTITRMVRGISQTDLAHRTGITRTVISRLENGHRPITDAMSTDFENGLNGFGRVLESDKGEWLLAATYIPFNQFP